MKRGKVYEYDQQPADLVIAMQEVAGPRGARQRRRRCAAFDEIVKREPYSGGAEGQGDRPAAVKQAGITRFLLLFRGSRSRSELVATFMAVLELCRKPDHPPGRSRRRTAPCTCREGRRRTPRNRHMEILEMKEIEAAVEGILFASGEPVRIDRICLALDLDRATAELVLQKPGGLLQL